MNVKNIEKESSKAKITVEIERDLMDSGANQAYLKARKDIQLPGFRKGKAPRKLIESIYGAHVFYEDGLEEIFPQVYQFAVVEQELKAVGRPSLTGMDIAEDGSVTIVLETELYPEVTLGQYRGLEVEKVEPSVTDEEVEAELDRMAKNVASRETVERPAADGDTVNLDFEGFDNGVAFEGGKGEKFDLVLGSGSFIPGFEEQVVGMSAGEEQKPRTCRSLTRWRRCGRTSGPSSWSRGSNPSSGLLSRQRWRRRRRTQRRTFRKPLWKKSWTAR